MRFEPTILRTRDAPERCAEMLRSPRSTANPGAILPWRIVPDVLRMSALQLGHPVALGILVEGNNPPRHCRPVREAHALSSEIAPEAS